MEKEHAPKAQITIPAASLEQEANWRTPQRFKQPALESADGKPFVWPERTAHTPQETPVYLRGQMERGLAVTVAKEAMTLTNELMQENQELSVKAAKYDRWVQSSIDSYNRRKEADPKGMREKARIRKAKQRAREKLEAQSQEKSQQQSGKHS